MLYIIKLKYLGLHNHLFLPSYTTKKNICVIKRRQVLCFQLRLVNKLSALNLVLQEKIRKK